MLRRKPDSVSVAQGARAADEGQRRRLLAQGLPVCTRLQLTLGKKVSDVVRVDVWVVVGGVPHTNPSPREVVAVV